MIWFYALVLTILLIVFAIWFLQRFFAKATPALALVRTGLGGRKVVLDGGCISLPFIHALQRVSMAAIPVSVERKGRDAVMCRDQLRADIQMDFELRVEPTRDGVSSAAQSLGARISRPGEALTDLVHGFLIDGIHAAASKRTLDEIHLDRADFAAEVAAGVTLKSADLGLRLLSSSLVYLDQTDFGHFDENNAFNAQGMRRLAEVVSEERKARVSVETQTEIAIRQSRLDQHRRQLEIQKEEQEAEVLQREHLAKLEAVSQSRSDQAAAEADLASETFQIEKERAAKASKVQNDEALRKAEMKALLELEEVKIANSIQLARRRAEESTVKAEEEEARAQVILAGEHVQSQKDRAVVERENEVALLKQRRDIELENARVKSDVDTVLAKAKAKASATTIGAEAERARMEAEASGMSARYAAENTLSEAIIQMRLEERKLDRLPEIMTQMMKPVEKIDSIRINQIAGMGDQGGGAGPDTAFGAAMDQILGMAVRLPAMKQMGEEIGLDFDANLAGRTADYANRIKPKKDEKA